MMNFLLFLLLTVISSCKAQCDTCTEYNVKCVSSTTYQYCVYSTGQSIGDPFTCASGEICSTSAAESPSVPCAVAVPYLEPDCLCGWCNEDLNYACVGATQLQLCLDGGTPNLPTITCPLGTMCDYRYDSGGYCGTNITTPCSNDITTIAPTTITTTTQSTTVPSTTARVTTTTPTTTTPSTTTTTTTTVSPTFSCTQVGKFPLPGTNCQSYITCVLLDNGTWGSYIYFCTSGNYFNPATKRCSSAYICP